LSALNLIFLGTAGCGKSTMTSSFGKWLEKELGMKTLYVNLDPGCEQLPYQPDFDVRNYFTITELMRREGLGPNGAMIRACELMESKIPEFALEINRLGGEVRLLDTPGQMEVFLFHGGPEMAKLVEGFTVCLFLMDAKLVLQSFGSTLVRLLGLSVGLRMGIPTVSILNKIDLIERREELERLLAVPAFGTGVLSDLTGSLSQLLLQFLPPARILKTSAISGEGFKEMYDLIHETRCACGDLT